ncbi:hypothetical protein NDU88_000314 [Pleurodeles waltl]|uniref:Uncharacterized protein n=1 Tax=Pleurodeles waltl TaxID=8319 RepID=A0AAV7S475_PLEWA|nr:hypothetical protein NDU88_000314 [Pleurodeles waltl]
MRDAVKGAGSAHPAGLLSAAPLGIESPHFLSSGTYLQYALGETRRSHLKILTNMKCLLPGRKTVTAPPAFNPVSSEERAPNTPLEFLGIPQRR